jgi:hypothetical protein
MNTYIFISAVIIFSLLCTCLILYPVIIGRPRKPFSISDWITQIIQAGLLIPILGRIFGWW